MNTDAETWTSLAKWAIWGLSMAAIMGWVTLQRHKSIESGSPNRMSHPKAILGIGLVGFVFFAGIAAISNAFPNDSVSWWTTAIFLGFAALSSLMIVEYYRVHHEYSEDGLDYGRLFGKGGFIRWELLSAVNYAHTMKWFRLEAHSGEVARISAYLSGLPQFAETLLRNAPAGSIDQNTLAILKDTANGNPPPLW